MGVAPKPALQSNYGFTSRKKAGAAVCDQLLELVPSVAFKSCHAPPTRLVLYCKCTPGRPSQVMGKCPPAAEIGRAHV